MGTRQVGGDVFTRRLLQLHARALTGSSEALNDIGQMALPFLVCALRRRFPRVTNDEIESAVDDALLDYMRRPTCFDPNRGTGLIGFLLCVAQHNLLDYVRREVRRRKAESAYLDRMSVLRSESWPSHEALGVIQRAMAMIRDPSDKDVLARWLNGEDSLSLSIGLGLDHLSICERRRRVHQTLERILKRLRRRSSELRKADSCFQTSRK